VKVCPSCGRRNEADALFCSGCGTALETPEHAREERKVVTCLFCDLVGFTARAESMDPEEVRRLLQPYHARVRTDLERFGGTVEKFIGDAVMAVFGAPVAHEDDPERAVRSALAIRDRLGEEEHDIRIGITTGEALITLDARPDAGEGLAAGDVVNTAARVQAGAPRGEILVDETTFRATERVIEYEAAEPVSAKGKSRPVPVWKAVRARSRVGVERLSSTSFVGREREVALLDETLARALRERRPQLMTLVGVPGIGKSRLVFELFRRVDAGKELVYWRHGRSLPYGDGVTFWALAEMVKAQAGILESDPREHAGEKLMRSVRELVPDASDADWVERHLRPLAGLETESAGAGETAGQSFAAWRRFLEALAEVRPLVLVFEDLHWADDALLDFVDYLLDWARGVPLLALCTARPELLSRRPTWGGGKVNSTTILLSALDEDETTELVDSLLADVALGTDVRARLVERSSGNPLYAEEFTRLLAARPNGVELPETVQGIIAARLDTLPQEEKELLQEAAVMGRVFWLGALGRERWTVEERLHSLERKEFVTRERRSSVAGEAEYVFRHVLVRDVAYDQIPKAERAAKHLAAAHWIDSLGRPEDHAELLAHHYAAALHYSRAAGQDARPVAERGRVALREAGDRAFSLKAFPAATRYYALAVELWPQDDPERAELLFSLARARHLGADELRGESLEEARDALLLVGRAEQAAEADALLAEVWWYRGNRPRCDFHLERAAAEIAELPDSAAKAFVLSQIARYRMLADEFEDAIRIGEEALAMSEHLGLDETRAHALDTIGVSRDALGDPRGLAQLEEAAELATRLRSPEAIRALNNISVRYASLGDFTRQGEYLRKAFQLGEELGALSITSYVRAILAANLIWTGAWDEGLRLADAIVAEGGREIHAGEMQLMRNRALARLARDDVDGALDDIRRALESSHEMEDLQTRIPALGAAARVYLELGRDDRARELAAELVEQLRNVADWRLIDLAFVAARLGYAERLLSVLEPLPPNRLTRAIRALVLEDFDRAAGFFDDGGAALLAADARRLAGEKLAREGQVDEARQQLEAALAFYRSVRATRNIRTAEALLGELSEVSA